MQRSAPRAAATLSALLVGSGLALWGQAPPPAPAAHATAGHPVPPKPKHKLVELNSAGKAQLMTLPGVTGLYAAEIIAGRPYLSKANLVTHNILPMDVYQGLRDRVVVHPPKVQAPRKK